MQIKPSFSDAEPVKILTGSFWSKAKAAVITRLTNTAALCRSCSPPPRALRLSRALSERSRDRYPAPEQFFLQTIPGCLLSPTLFNIYLKDFMKNCFQNEGELLIGGRKIKCIRFSGDMTLLAEEEVILKDMLLALNDSCERYGMKINANKTNTVVVGRKIKKVNVRIRNEALELDSFKYLGFTININIISARKSKG
ncbi:hypothetical protein ANN_22336 [Periplaneta americana]|uniref:Reverse transcriptase domain-containing protein n=1 Tax=Periplaneta americana TaxID=6978 RepID=A0ABQ8S8B8_PERAM|nr:hypothetical protein ANN_22336 [Periplaneta americana]